MAQRPRRRGRPPLPADAIRIRCVVTREAHPALHEALSRVDGRRRHERLRALAQLGALVETGAWQGAPVQPATTEPQEMKKRPPSSVRIGDDFLGLIA